MGKIPVLKPRVAKDIGVPVERLAFAPDYAIPPGETLLETIEALGMTQADLAARAGRPLKREALAR